MESTQATGSPVKKQGASADELWATYKGLSAEEHARSEEADRAWQAYVSAAEVSRWEALCGRSATEVAARYRETERTWSVYEQASRSQRDAWDAASAAHLAFDTAHRAGRQ